MLSWYLRKVIGRRKTISDWLGYSIASNSISHPVPNAVCIRLHKKLKVAYSLVDICVYKGEILSDLLHHLSYNNSFYHGSGLRCYRNPIPNNEVDLVLARYGASAGSCVGFETLWGKCHTEAEDGNDADGDFICWLETCMVAYAAGAKPIVERTSKEKTFCSLDGMQLSDPHKDTNIEEYDNGQVRGVVVR